MRRVVSRTAALLAVCALLLPTVALAAQASPASLTETDLQRLRTAVSDARTEIDRAKSRDPQLASSLSKQLNDLSDEVTYLSVRLKKEHQVPRSEYLDLRDRIDDVRAKAQGDRPAHSETSARQPDSAIPVGTELDVRLLDPLSSGRNQVEDRFRGSTVVDLQVGERVLIPAGSEMRGVISAVDKAGRIDRKGSLQLAFDQITVNGKDYPLHGTVTQALEGEGIKGEIGKLGTAAAIGGIIGGIIGGGKGAVAGVLIGGGGIAAATPGTDAELKAGTILRVRLDQPPAVN
jgi:TolA-binding protein